MSRRAEIALRLRPIGRTYVRWAPSLLLLALIVFIPLGLIHAIAIQAEVGSFDLDSVVEMLAAGGGGTDASPPPA